MGRTDWERELGEGLREVPCQGQEENRWYREGGTNFPGIYCFCRFQPKCLDDQKWCFWSWRWIQTVGTEESVPRGMERRGETWDTWSFVNNSWQTLFFFLLSIFLLIINDLLPKWWSRWQYAACPPSPAKRDWRLGRQGTPGLLIVNNKSRERPVEEMNKFLFLIQNLTKIKKKFSLTIFYDEADSGCWYRQMEGEGGGR